MQQSSVFPRLSVNLNKIALLRNSRKKNFPDVLQFARLSLANGADGITMHPRPDLRHITPEDVFEFRDHFPDVELNLEGNPFSEANTDYPGFLSIVRQTSPEQCTLVPDSQSQLTSDHGWDLKKDFSRLRPIIETLSKSGIRVSLFADPGCENLELARDLGADRIELYTGPFHDAFAGPDETEVFKKYMQTATRAKELELGLNAGHDLNLENLEKLCELPNLLEVSIGHALTVDALLYGFGESVRKYKNKILSTIHTSPNNL